MNIIQIGNILTRTILIFGFGVLCFGCSSDVIKIDTKNYTGNIFSGDSFSASNCKNSVIDTLKFIDSFSAHGNFSGNAPIVTEDFLMFSDLAGRFFCYNYLNQEKIGELNFKKKNIYSTPLIRNNKAYLFTTIFNTEFSSLIIYDFNEGKITNESEFIGKAVNEPILDESGIYIVLQKGSVVKFDFNGNLVFRVEVESFTNCTPVLYQGCLYFGDDDGFIYKINKHKGFLESKKIIANSPISFVTNQSGKLFLSTDTEGIILFDTLLEKKFVFASGSKIKSKILVGGEKIYFGDLEGYAYCFDIIAGKSIWKRKIATMLAYKPAQYGNFLLFADSFGKLIFVDANTGKEIYSYPIEGRIKMPPICKGNKLFVGKDFGIVELYEIIIK